jgi:hypothetical protein
VARHLALNRDALGAAIDAYRAKLDAVAAIAHPMRRAEGVLARQRRDAPGATYGATPAVPADGSRER